MWIAFSLLAVVSYGTSNLIDSVLVRWYEKKPWMLQWGQGVFMLVLLFFCFFFGDIRSTWVLALMITGVIAYLGDAVFFTVVDDIDISVTNSAWAVVALLLSIAGFLFFHERWTLLQSLGALCIVSGIFFVSFWHAHISVPRTLLRFAGLALLYIPISVITKAGLLGGQSYLAIFFWATLGRQLCACVVPLLRPAQCRILLRSIRTLPAAFFMLSALSGVCAFAGMFLVVQAYRSGPLSLVSIIGSTQAFFVLMSAWLLSLVFPSFAAKELLSAQSVSIKIISFTIVFFGLALLALTQ
ncbi:hypothetical protein HZA45_03275 [Candidatus Peregrinibacteria bacterium]|nr:hypothetical protein [Candidatus Peregrinibacteria bacterium]